MSVTVTVSPAALWDKDTEGTKGTAILFKVLYKYINNYFFLYGLNELTPIPNCDGTKTLSAFVIPPVLYAS